MKNDTLGIRVGTTIKNIFEVSAHFHPKLPKLNNPGFAGGNIKLLLFYFPLIQKYESAFLMGTLLDYTAGVIFLPNITSPIVALKKTAFGNAGSIGLEFMRIGQGILISIPIELGYGRLHFNQQFADQIPDPISGYNLQSTAYILMGFKIFLSMKSCDDYIEKLRNGN